MKYKKCPKCGESCLGDKWKRGRKLQQYCYECDWEGKIRTPEKQKIEPIRIIDAGQFGGYSYEIFDKYGHIMVDSRFYGNRKEALDELQKELNRGKLDKDAGPYTAILWPATVKVKGKVFK